MHLRTITSLLATITIITSCTTANRGILGKKTPHESYGQRLRDAGLEQTAVGTLWFTAAAKSLLEPVLVNLPFQETGYFGANNPRAVSFQFGAKRGEKVNVSFIKKAIGTAALYVELWEKSEGANEFKLVASPEANIAITYVVKSPSNYLLRIQPELLKSIEYTVVISTGPSLAYPVGAPGNNHIKSVFGVARDGGARKHEGIDMFAPLRTPLLAAAKGTISRVEQTQLGGNVVWLRPDDHNLSLYYAHLDKQLVRSGQRVNAGDTVGLMGNTGNAISTSPHLHFGIYAPGGAIDPYPFVYKTNEAPPKISSSLSALGKMFRIDSKNARLSANPDEIANQKVQANAPIKVEAALKNKFRVSFVDGTMGYISSGNVVPIDKPLRKYKVPDRQILYDHPADSALKITTLQAGETVNVHGEHGDYEYVMTRGAEGWIEARR